MAVQGVAAPPPALCPVEVRTILFFSAKAVVVIRRLFVPAFARAVQLMGRVTRGSAILCPFVKSFLVYATTQIQHESATKCARFTPPPARHL